MQNDIEGIDKAGSSFGKTRHTGFRVLAAISFSHFLNDMIQSLILAIYPLIKGTFQLTFAQIGLITLTYQITASLLQPMVGFYTDRHPKPYSLALGMAFTLVGLLVLAAAPNYSALLVAAALVGTGSSIFHQSRHEWPAWLQAASTGWPSRSSRSGGIQEARLGRYLPRG